MPAGSPKKNPQNHVRMGAPETVKFTGIDRADAALAEFDSKFRFHYREIPKDATLLTQSLYTDYDSTFATLNAALDKAVFKFNKDELGVDEKDKNDKEKNRLASAEARVAAFLAQVQLERKKLSQELMRTHGTRHGRFNRRELGARGQQYLYEFDRITAKRLEGLKQHLVKHVNDLNEREYYRNFLLSTIHPATIDAAIKSGTFDPDAPKLEDLKVIPIPTKITNISPVWSKNFLIPFDLQNWVYNRGYTIGPSAGDIPVIGDFFGLTKQPCIHIRRDPKTNALHYDIDAIPYGTSKEAIKTICAYYVAVMKEQGLQSIEFTTSNQLLIYWMKQYCDAHKIYVTFIDEHSKQAIPVESIIDPYQAQAGAVDILEKEANNPTRIPALPNESARYQELYRSEVAALGRKYHQEDEEYVGRLVPPV